MPDERQVLLQNLHRKFGNRLFSGQARVYTVVGIVRTPPATVTLRPAVTDPADTEGDVAEVGFLSSYIPELNDLVQVINSNGSPYVIGGIDPIGQGRRIAKTLSTSVAGAFNDTVEHVLLSTTAMLLPGHVYEIGARWRGVSFSVAGTTIVVPALNTISPAAVTTLVADQNMFGGSTNVHEANNITAELDTTGLDCTSAWTFQFTMKRVLGASTFTVSATTTSPMRLWVDDLGRP